MTDVHKTKVWDDDGIWGWSCLCGQSDSGWEEQDNAIESASAHFWSNHDPETYIGTGGDRMKPRYCGAWHNPDDGGVGDANCVREPGHPRETPHSGMGGDPLWFDADPTANLNDADA
jgi:hypothetical protein